MGTLTQTMEFTNLGDPVMFTNPYPRFAELRRNAPVSRAKAPMVVRGHAYLLTRFDDVMFLHSDPRFSSDALSQGVAGKFTMLLPESLKLLTQTMTFKDDPDHKRLRTLVHKAFTPKLVAEMEDSVTRIAGELIDRIAVKREIDLVDDFAIQLPLSVITTMLGVNDADRDVFHRLCYQLAEDSMAGLAGTLRNIRTGAKLLAFFKHLVGEQRLHPDEGLISGLIEASEDGEKLSEREILAMIYLLLLAGHDTTANLIGSSILALLNAPDQLTELRANPDLIGTGIEELLRFTSPVTCGVARVATEDVEVAGTTIPKGSQVLGMIISANRDDTVFHNPDELDLHRKPNKHLAFAFGAHYCMGHHLARLEGRVALTALLRRFEHFEPTVPVSGLRYKPTISLRGLNSFPMRVS